MLAPLLVAAALVVPGFSVVRPLEPLALHARPGGPVVARVGRWTSFGSPQVLGVGATRRGWVGVITPALPNGRLGWVRGRLVRFGAVRMSISVDLSAHRLVLRRGSWILRRIPVAVGRPGSPTPEGRFSVTDKLPGSAIYGCCVLALSGHQPHPPPGWVGGTRLAIHGGSVDGAVSAGCLHASEADLRFLMSRVPLGTPVVIHA